MNMKHDPNKKGTAVNKDCYGWIKGTCKNEWCKFNHAPEKEGARPKAKAKPQSHPPVPDVSHIPCRYEPKGQCTRGADCPFKHLSRATEAETVVQGITVGSLAGAIADALQSKSSTTPVAALSTTANNETTIKQGRLTEDDRIPFVIGRPVYVITVGHGGTVYNLHHAVLRRQVEDRPFDFEKILSELPIRPAPPRGYHFGSDLSCRGCPGLVIHVIWDGGPEGASISDRALSRILRAQ